MLNEIGVEVPFEFTMQIASDRNSCFLIQNQMITCILITKSDNKKNLVECYCRKVSDMWDTGTHFVLANLNSEHFQKQTKSHLKQTASVTFTHRNKDQSSWSNLGCLKAFR